MIGIIGAMQVEIDKIKSTVENPTTETVSGIEFVSGKIHGHDAVVAVCGIGKVFAAVCAQTMILKYNPDVIINVGVAGTLTDKLSIADIAVASDVVQHDMDTSPLGDPVGLVSGINVIKFPADIKTVEKIEKSIDNLGINRTRGTIASGDQFMSDKDKKQKIVDNFDAIACEMEGASIGHVCYINGVNFAVIRSISDSADDSAFMDYPEFVKKAAANSSAVIDGYFKLL